MGADTGGQGDASPSQKMEGGCPPKIVTLTVEYYEQFLVVIRYIFVKFVNTYGNWVLSDWKL